MKERPPWCHTNAPSLRLQANPVHVLPNPGFLTILFRRPPPRPTTPALPSCHVHWSFHNTQ